MKRSEALLEADAQLASTNAGPETLDVSAAPSSKSPFHYHAWVADRIAVYTVRIENSELIERSIRDKIALRAELTWEDDRTLEAVILGGQLATNPERVVEALRRTPQGCEWLMERWALLAHAADQNPGHLWTDKQTALAFDLMATPAAFRSNKPGIWIDSEGKLTETVDDLAALARRMIAELKERRDVVEELDQLERALAASDLSHDADAELRRHRRHDATLHNRFRWFVKQMSELSPGETAEPKPAAKPEPKPAPKPEKPAEARIPTASRPPLNPVPNPLPPVLGSRREKRAARAESRRDAKRRKLESCLA